MRFKRISDVAHQNSNNREASNAIEYGKVFPIHGSPKVNKRFKWSQLRPLSHMDCKSEGKAKGAR